VLDAPVFALPGDRLILRNAQASRTIAGGCVLDPDAPERKRRSPERVATLDALEALITEGDARPLIASAPLGLARSQLQRLMGRALAPADLQHDLQDAAIAMPLGADDAEEDDEDEDEDAGRFLSAEAESTFSFKDDEDSRRFLSKDAERFLLSRISFWRFKCMDNFSKLSSSSSP
jgi:hypothetical protein